MAISEGCSQGGWAAKFMVMLPHLDERQRRLYLGSEAAGRWGMAGSGAGWRRAGGGGCRS